MLNMSFGDRPTTTMTSGMQPFGILLDGFQPLVLADAANCYPTLYFDFIFARWMIPECIHLYANIYKLVSSAGRRWGRNVM